MENLEVLSLEYQKEINGGTQESYDIGKNVGKHIRAAIMTFGEFVDALSPFS